MNKSNLEKEFLFQIRATKLPVPRIEYKFHTERLWRFDFAFLDKMLAVEIQGGTWLKKGGHTTGAGYERDCEKKYEAMMLGWRVLEVTSNMVRDGRAIYRTERLLLL